jgi:hypothetical protein
MVVKPSDATIMVFEARSIMKIPSYMKDRTFHVTFQWTPQRMKMGMRRLAK